MTATGLVFTFDPSQPRDDHGRWTDGGGEGASPATGAVQNVASKYKTNAAVVSKAKGVKPELQDRVDALSKDMGGRIIDLSGVAPKLQPGVVAAVEKFHDAYPDVRVEMLSGDPTVGIGRMMIDDPNATMASTGRHILGSAESYKTGDTVSGIYLNERFFGNAGLMSRAVQENRDAGYLTRGPADAAEQTVTHELGHALANSLSAGVAGSPFEQAIKTVASSDLYSVPAIRRISRYATESDGEFVAEAFANAAGPQPTDLARLVTSTMTDAYHQRFG